MQNEFKSKERQNFSKSNGKPMKKPFNKKKPLPKYEGFKNGIKLQRLDPSGHSETFISKYFIDVLNRTPDLAKALNINSEIVTNDDVIRFRHNLFNGYHLYKIMVSVENHFVSGYTYRTVGWVVGHSANRKDHINMTIVIDNEVIKNSHGNKLYSILYFKAMALASELFLKSGYATRIMLPKESYNVQKKFLNKSWFVDNEQVFTEPLGNRIDLKNEDSKYIVLKNLASTMPIKIGDAIDCGLLNYLWSTYDRISYIKAIPFVGVKLFEKIGEDSVEFARVTKCDKDKNIHLYCKHEDVDILCDVINAGIEYENSFYKHPYDNTDDISIIYKGDITKSDNK